jgi:hypothetical protein
MNPRLHVHAALGLILIACLVCPFVETAIGWNDTIFCTGYDTESLVAVVTLLAELVLALATSIVILVAGLRKIELVAATHPVLFFAIGRDSLPADSSPPVPLRI